MGRSSQKLNVCLLYLFQNQFICVPGIIVQLEHSTGSKFQLYVQTWTELEILFSGFTSNPDLPLVAKQPQSQNLPALCLTASTGLLDFKASPLLLHTYLIVAQSLSRLATKLFSRRHLDCPCGQLQISDKLEGADF